jgi:hypothetical protein
MEEKEAQKMLGIQENQIYMGMEYVKMTHEIFRCLLHLFYITKGNITMREIVAWLINNSKPLNRYNLYNNYLMIFINTGIIKEVTNEVLNTEDIKNRSRRFNVMDRVFRRSE